VRRPFSSEEELHVARSFLLSRPDTLLRGLCLVVLLTIVIAVLYAAWIGISNYSRIGV
jgi:hypothetical protein